jgi:hypothetical protein
MDHAVYDLSGVHPVPCPGLVEHVGTEIHIFKAAGNDHVGIPALDSLGRQHHGLQPGPADFVYGDGADAPWESGLDHSLSSRILTKPVRKNAPHDDLGHILRSDLRSPDRLFDHERPKIRSRHSAERASEVPKGSPARAGYHHFSHAFSFQTERYRTKKEYIDSAFSNQEDKLTPFPLHLPTVFNRVQAGRGIIRLHAPFGAATSL